MSRRGGRLEADTRNLCLQQPGKACESSVLRSMASKLDSTLLMHDMRLHMQAF